MRVMGDIRIPQGCRSFLRLPYHITVEVKGNGQVPPFCQILFKQKNKKEKDPPSKRHTGSLVGEWQDHYTIFSFKKKKRIPESLLKTFYTDNSLKNNMGPAGFEPATSAV